MKKNTFFVSLFLALSLVLSSCALPGPGTEAHRESPAQLAELNLSALPEFEGSPYVILHENKPYFTEDEITTDAFERYTDLDALGRCGEAVACIGKELMPTEERGSIGQVKPSGWQTVKYDMVDGKYLYNRCHLIGFQLTGENANEENLITGTRYLNVDGMLPFENMVADFVKESSFHVMYRVTPVFYGDELLARGVMMEAISVEDHGEGIEFCVYCFNAQPGIEIDYTNGTSSLQNDPGTAQKEEAEHYILNTNSKKIHKADCGSARSISEKNRQEVTESLSSLKLRGYTPAGCCF